MILTPHHTSKKYYTKEQLVFYGICKIAKIYSVTLGDETADFICPKNFNFKTLPSKYDKYLEVYTEDDTVGFITDMKICHLRLKPNQKENIDKLYALFMLRGLFQDEDI